MTFSRKNKPRPVKGRNYVHTFSEVTIGITQLELTSKAGFAVSFYVHVLRNITAAIPIAIAVILVG